MKSSLIIALIALGLVSRAAAVDAPPTDVVIIDHAQVDASFAKGGAPWFANSSFRVQAGRRVAGGQVEIHAHDTDLLWVTEGSATLITGGKAIGTKDKGPGEQVAEKIEGGVTRKVVKGDLIVIPPNIPHWFSAVDGTFLYFVVKVTK